MKCKYCKFFFIDENEVGRCKQVLGDLVVEVNPNFCCKAFILDEKYTNVSMDFFEILK